MEPMKETKIKELQHQNDHQIKRIRHKSSQLIQPSNITFLNTIDFDVFDKFQLMAITPVCQSSFAENIIKIKLSITVLIAGTLSVCSTIVK